MRSGLLLCFVGSLLVIAGCAPAPAKRADHSLPELQEMNVEVTPAPDSSASAPVAPLEEQGTCAPGEEPRYTYGFAALRQFLGARMGEPMSCERTSVDTGDSLQQTTNGLARYLKAQNVPTFSSGVEHWALTDRGVVYWVGRSVNVPDDAQPMRANQDHVALNEDPSQRPNPTPPPAEAPAPLVHAGPEWLRHPLDLLVDYDRRHGTILDKAIETSTISVVDLSGAWAAYIPKGRTITLDPVLRTESPEAIATVLAHEGQHAVDSKINGRNRSDPEIRCYTWEISAFHLQAAFWQSLYGDAGKPNPTTALEHELNDILRMARTDAGQLISRIRERYRDQCL